MLIRKAILIDLIQQQLKLQGGFTKSTEVRHAKVTKLLIQSKNLRELLVLDSIKYYIWQTGIKKHLIKGHKQETIHSRILPLIIKAAVFDFTCQKKRPNVPVTEDKCSLASELAY
jgi:hypothetical protein